jgi:hypothetical protein
MTIPLAIFMEERGRDSWGVTDGDLVLKQATAITDGFVELDLDGPTYHTRAHSVGAVSQRNAHPFDYTFENKRVVGVHNGHINNWLALKNRYDRKDLEVDSEHIFRHLAEGKSVEEIGGWGAVVWYEMDPAAPEARQRYLSKFGGMDNLHIATLDVPTHPIVFASSAEAIKRAAGMCGVEIRGFYSVATDIKYQIKLDEATGEYKLFNLGAMPWGKKSHESVAVDFPYHRHRGRNTAAECADPACDGILDNPSRQLFCKKCVRRIFDEYFGVYAA